jgi:hypothetical protein
LRQVTNEFHATEVIFPLDLIQRHQLHQVFLGQTQSVPGANQRRLRIRQFNFRPQNVEVRNRADIKSILCVLELLLQ